MNLLVRVVTLAAHKVGIYPHDGKKIVYIKNGELHEGEVIGPAAFTGHTKLGEVNEVRRLGILVEAANSLGVPPGNVERRLARGEMVMYRRHEELK